MIKDNFYYIELNGDWCSGIWCPFESLDKATYYLMEYIKKNKYIIVSKKYLNENELKIKTDNKSDFDYFTIKQRKHGEILKHEWIE